MADVRSARIAWAVAQGRERRTRRGSVQTGSRNGWQVQGSPPGPVAAAESAEDLFAGGKFPVPSLGKMTPNSLSSPVVAGLSGFRCWAFGSKIRAISLYFPVFRGWPRQAKTTRRRANGDWSGKNGALQARSRDQRQAVCLRVRQRRGNVGAISRVTGTRQLSRKCVADREGFEPSVPLTKYDGLAIRWFQPLTHLSFF